MRISWLTADEIAEARTALRAGGKTWDDHFHPEFTPPTSPAPADEADPAEWPAITEHVARAERVSEVVRDEGLDAARARFAGTTKAIEAATLAAAGKEGEDIALDHVLAVFACAVDPYVFYAPFLEMLVELGKHDVDRVVSTYEQFVAAYAAALAAAPQGAARINAARDGLADYYVSAGRLDDAEALFERRHAEDQNDVAVALSASRAFLAAGSIAHAVRWLGIGAGRATTLGRADLASRLETKAEKIRQRLS